MLAPFTQIPDNTISEYTLQEKVSSNDMVLCDIRKGMYSLPHVGRLAYAKLVKYLAIGGCAPSKHTPGLFRYTIKALKFSHRG